MSLSTPYKWVAKTIAFDDIYFSNIGAKIWIYFLIFLVDYGTGVGVFFRLQSWKMISKIWFCDKFQTFLQKFPCVIDNMCVNLIHFHNWLQPVIFTVFIECKTNMATTETPKMHLLKGLILLWVQTNIVITSCHGVNISAAF